MLSLMLILFSGQVVAAGTLTGLVLKMRHQAPKPAFIKVPAEE